MTLLQALALDDTNISDAGLVHLRSLTGLQRLDLRGTQVTGEGVAELLRALPNLEDLNLDDTHISAEAVGELREQRPHLSVRGLWKPSLTLGPPQRSCGRKQ